jgi:competence CoiA-like predicted nuclease
MPFKAADENNNILYSFNLENRPDLELHCPHCESNMIPVWDSEFVINHFRHKRTCPYESEPESPEHLLGKLFLYNWLKPRTHLKIDLEKKIGHGIADVYVEWPNTRMKAAIEYQNSAIGGQKVYERSANYIENDVYYLWIFHDKFRGLGPEKIMRHIQGRAYFLQIQTQPKTKITLCYKAKRRDNLGCTVSGIYPFDLESYLTLTWKPDYKISTDWWVIRGKFRKIPNLVNGGNPLNSKVLMIEDAI